MWINYRDYGFARKHSELEEELETRRKQVADLGKGETAEASSYLRALFGYLLCLKLIIAYPKLTRSWRRDKAQHKSKPLC